MTPRAHPTQDERVVDELVARGLSALPDLAAAREAAESLACCKGDRAVFALCLLTLERALAGDDSAREELPGHVPVLLEAYRDPSLPALLTAGNPALALRWERVRPVVADFVALQQAPPPRQTPGRMPRLATPVELIEEIEEILESDPPPHRRPPPPPAPVGPGKPPPPPPPSVRAPASPPPERQEKPLDTETRAFWAFANEALGRLPDPRSNVLGTESLAATRSADRTRLVRFAHSALAQFPRCEQARALAALVLLYVACQEKERGLLGGVKRDRQRMIHTGLSLIGDPEAAAQAAVLFESDGPETLGCFAGVVDLVQGYLAFCLRNGLDPSAPETRARYCSLS